jgi:transposase-like protein
MALSAGEKAARELAEITARLSSAEARVTALRAQLDARRAYWHDKDVSIAALARATGVSRETVYKSIARHRSHAGAGPPA